MKCTKYKTLTNLPTKKAMQKFYLDDNNIYIVQYDADKNIQYISKCDLDGKCESTITINNSGHSQTFYPYKNKFMIATHPTACKTASKKWATDIGLINFKNYSNYTEVKRFITMVSGMDRVESNVSPNGELLVLHVHYAKGGSLILVYKTKCLDLINSSSVKFSKAKAYLVSSHKGNVNMLGYGSSNQGIAIDNNGDIYIVGGAIGKKPQIRKSHWNGKEYKVVKTVNLTNDDFGSGTEAESIQLLNDKIYVGVNDKTKTDRASIYEVEMF